MIKDPNCKNKNYKAEVLDGIILDEIKKLSLDSEYMKEVQDAKPVNNAADKMQTIKTEIEKIDTQISKMMDLYALGTIDLDAISDKVAVLNRDKTGLQKELDSLKGSGENDEELTAKQVKDIAELMEAGLTIEQKRSIVQSLIYYIEIDEEDILIHWKF